MKNRFRNKLVEGTVFGILAAATTYTIVTLIGYNSASLAVILYFQLIFGIALTMRSELATPLLPLLKKVVLVIEGEEVRLKRILTGEEYKVRDIEKL